MKEFLLKYKLIIAGLVILLLFFFVNKINRNLYLAEKDKVAVLENNLKAAQDTIRTFKTKDGSPEFDKLAYVINSMEDLKVANYELQLEVKNLKGDIRAVQKTDFVVVHDTVEAETNTVVDNGTLYAASNLDTVYSPGNYRKLSFLTRINLGDSTATGSVLQDEIGFTAVTGIKKTISGYEIFVNPKYPNMKVLNLEGAIVSENLFVKNKNKPKLVTIGLSLNWVPMTYDISDKKIDLSIDRIGVGAGLNFNLGRLLSK